MPNDLAAPEDLSARPPVERSNDVANARSVA